MASIPPLTVWLSGRVACTDGSMTDTLGTRTGDAIAHLLSSSSLVTTAVLFISEEVPDAVSTP